MLEVLGIESNGERIIGHQVKFIERHFTEAVDIEEFKLLSTIIYSLLDDLMSGGWNVRWNVESFKEPRLHRAS